MTHYYRLSGGGNDFLALTGDASKPGTNGIRSLCRRGLSAGADGLFILRRLPQGAELQYFNADGRPAELCLNATRCAVRLADHLGWSSGPTRIETGAGTITGRLTGPGTVALELPPPAAPVVHTLSLANSSWNGWQVDVGVPHFVMVWRKSLAGAPVAELGPQLRHHPDWGERGSNVDFVRFIASHALEIRTFERGVEGETLACGTGVMASVAAGLTAGALELPVRALTLGGFELEVSADESGPQARWSLAGDARLIAEGDLCPEALAVPPPPEWTS